MGNRVAVAPHTDSTDMVSIRKIRKNAKPYSMGSVMLKSVTVTVAGLEGEWLEEWTEARELAPEVLSKMTRIFHTEKGWHRFGKGNKREPVTGNQYRAAYVCGDEFYVA